MADDPTPTLRRILEDAKAKGWTPAALHQDLTARGLTLTLQAVCNWFKGGNISPRHRVVLAAALDLPAATVLSAVAESDDDPAQAAG
jgi:hypothetical protein